MARNSSSPPGPPGADPFYIGALVDDLVPVRRMLVREGLGIALAVAVLCSLVIAFWLGVRGDVANGIPHGMFILRSITLLGLGIAAAAAAIASGTPSVGGKGPAGWKWMLAVAAIFPVGALITLLANLDTLSEVARPLDPQYGMQCLRMSALCGAVVGTAMVLWMKRGAPVNPQRTGWLVGLASGALGAAAYSISCSENVIMYIGTWYTIAIAGCAIAGRLIVPPVLRW
jgi:hypothetical protein